MAKFCILNSPISGGNSHYKLSTLLSSIASVLFLITSALFVLTAFRNTLTWHFQKFWGASGNFWQSGWDKILDHFGEDPFTYWYYGSLFVTVGVYWFIGGIYTLLDVFNRPNSLRCYKVQPGTNEPVDLKRILMVILNVLTNQFIVGMIVGLLWYRLMLWRGFPEIKTLPSFHWVLAELSVHILVEEISFYYSHRLLHHRLLYKLIHKKHHEWTAPIAITALYCHPVEHVLSNLLPPFLGVFITGSHVATAYLWFTIAVISTLNAHSGYHWPFFPSPEAHDFHHAKFNQCFGVLGVLDRLHGTHNLFRDSPAYPRHTTLLTLVPARELYPDVPTCRKSAAQAELPLTEDSLLSNHKMVSKVS
nr:PREDICTED: fatty acid hydroxylase domain-containing protein 2 [Bemisia tabaci]